MKPIYNAWFCQIELTSYCGRDCLYCSRYSKHVKKNNRQHMPLNILKDALCSLKKWPSKIGIIGGEPILHPEFEKCCEIIQEIYPRDKMGLWTSGGTRFNKLRSIIDKTFGFVAYNEHNKAQQELCYHQPLTLAISDIVPNLSLQKELIDDCWVQRTWCPTIGVKGAFFCEVACALDLILEGPGGYKIEPKWWDKKPEEFQDQVNRYCHLCGMAIPYKRELIKNNIEKFSPTTVKLFREHNLPNMENDKIEIIVDQLTKDELIENAKTWFPGNYRGDLHSDENTGEGKGSTIL